MPFKPSTRLKQAYERFNKLYWDGKLPSDVQIGYSEEINAHNCWGLTLGVEAEEAKDKAFRIYLLTKLQEPDMREFRLITLLHEMAHVALYPKMDHGKSFQEEMQRLVGRGAFKTLW